MLLLSNTISNKQRLRCRAACGWWEIKEQQIDSDTLIWQKADVQRCYTATCNTISMAIIAWKNDDTSYYERMKGQIHSKQMLFLYLPTASETFWSLKKKKIIFGRAYRTQVMLSQVCINSGVLDKLKQTAVFFSTPKCDITKKNRYKQKYTQMVSWQRPLNYFDPHSTFF